MRIKQEDALTGARRGPTFAAAGGLVGALAASSCCIVPLVLFSLGVSGAWIGNLTQLAPYQPYFIAATLGSSDVAIGWSIVARRLGVLEGEACARPSRQRLVKAALMVATVLVLAAIAYDFAAPILLNS